MNANFKGTHYGAFTFIQCSRSVVVNTDYIHNVDITNRVIQLKKQVGTVEIGIMYKKELRERFK